MIPYTWKYLTFACIWEHPLLSLVKKKKNLLILKTFKAQTKHPLISLEDNTNSSHTLILKRYLKFLVRLLITRLMEINGQKLIFFICPKY